MTHFTAGTMSLLAGAMCQSARCSRVYSASIDRRLLEACALVNPPSTTCPPIDSTSSANFDTSSLNFIKSNLKTARSMLFAGPFKRATPSTSSIAVSAASPSSNSLKRFAAASFELMLKSCAANQVRTEGFSSTWINSSMSRIPSPDSSACSNNLFIFLVCSFFSRSLWRIMILSSEPATLNVSCINTPLMTPMTAKPMVTLWAIEKAKYHSLTLSCRIRAITGQLPNVSSNMLRIALEHVPK
mmetsp:Transcript_78440/g.159447  ORF Transcript_78440/g.159447 Transcript_78440/m.159447 type:complete len:243 (-) Transcript_78440:937-1665(-)